MNQPTTYQSQIVKKGNIITVTLASPLKVFLKKYTTAIVVFAIFLSFYVLFRWDYIYLIMYPLVLQLVLYLIEYLLPSDINIGVDSISTERKSIVLTNIPYLDIHAQTFRNQVKIQLGEINFKLKNAADLPILLDAIIARGNLEFYENYQLSDNRQVVTFKGKHITKPLFSTFLIVKNDSTQLRISDITNQASWLEIPKKNGTQINFCSLSDANLTTQSLDIQTVNSLKVIIKRKRIELIANDIIVIYQSYFRKKKVELTNLRDGEKLYELLKDLPSLKNIKIEKIINNT